MTATLRVKQRVLLSVVESVRQTVGGSGGRKLTGWVASLTVNVGRLPGHLFR